MRDYVRMPNFNAVAAGGTPTLNAPTNFRYHRLDLTYTTTTAGGATQANMEAEISEIRLKVNSKVQRRFSAREAFDIYGYRGIPFQTGKLPIFFSEPWRRTPGGEDILAWGMEDVSTFQIEVDLASAGQTSTLSAKAKVDAVRQPMGQIVKWRKHNVGVTATGLVNVNTLPKNDALYAMHALSTDINSVVVQTDQRDRRDNTLADAQFDSTVEGWTPNSDWFHVDFSETGRVSDALLMTSEDGQRKVQDFQVDFDMSAAVSFSLLSEMIGPRD